jgi:hypothetical protein
LKSKNSINNQVGNQEKPKLFFYLIFCVLIICRLWLISGIPKMILAAPLDDLFFAKAAHNIIHGQWMGPYSQTTLIKGPFYAFFLIFSFLTGLPLLINETIFYIAACIALIIAIRPLISSKWWILLIFIVLLFCPVSFPSQLNLRVYREFIYLSLTLFIVAFSIGLFLRLRQKTIQFLFWSIGLGISTGAFLITREEGVWILPALFGLLLISVVVLWKKRIDKWRIRIGVLLLSVMICYLPTLVISSLNLHYYGFWGVAETLNPDFNRVLATLQRIKVTDWHPAIQVSKEAIGKAYTVSPLFSELESIIESSWSAYDYWDNLTVGSKPSWYIIKYGDGGADMSNGHFVWLLREAVFQSNQIDTSTFPHEFYKRLADQLEAACENRALDCYSTLSLPFIGNINERHFSIIGRMLNENFSSLLRGDYLGSITLDVSSWPVWPENNSDYEYFEEFIYNSTEIQNKFSKENDVPIIKGSTDIRLKMLNYKEIIMEKMIIAYRILTLLLFVISLMAWCVLSFLSVSKKKPSSQYVYWLISTFMLGLLFSRLLTLTIVDATTSMSAMGYGASIYIFVYMFSLIMVYWICVPGRQQLMLLIKKNYQSEVKTQ